MENNNYPQEILDIEYSLPVVSNMFEGGLTRDSSILVKATDGKQDYYISEQHNSIYLMSKDTTSIELQFKMKPGLTIGKMLTLFAAVDFYPKLKVNNAISIPQNINVLLNDNDVLEEFVAIVNPAGYSQITELRQWLWSNLGRLAIDGYIYGFINLNTDTTGIKYVDITNDYKTTLLPPLPDCISFIAKGSGLIKLPLGLENAEEIIIGQTAIKSLDYTLKKCVTLDISNTAIEVLPSLPKCKRLFLSGSRVETINEELPKLKYLQCHRLKFYASSLPHNCIVDCV